MDAGSGDSGRAKRACRATRVGPDTGGPSEAERGTTAPRPSPAEEAEAKSIIHQMERTDPPLVTLQAGIPKPCLVACAIAMYRGEKFKSDREAQEQFGVPKTTKVRRDWVDGGSFGGEWVDGKLRRFLQRGGAISALPPAAEPPPSAPLPATPPPGEEDAAALLLLGLQPLQACHSPPRLLPQPPPPMLDRHPLPAAVLPPAIAASSASTELVLKIRTLDSEDAHVWASPGAVVRALKQQLEAQLGVSAARQRLIFRGQVLRDEKRLSDYEVETGGVLILGVRPNGAFSSTSNDEPAAPPLRPPSPNARPRRPDVALALHPYAGPTLRNQYVVQLLRYEAYQRRIIAEAVAPTPYIDNDDYCHGCALVDRWLDRGLDEACCHVCGVVRHVE